MVGETIQKSDVLCVRGGTSNHHHGNIIYRQVVARNKPLYLSCPKHHKIVVARAIVTAVKQQDPPGRFLQKEGGVWVEISDKKAIEKTSQALREKERRTKRSDDSGDEDDQTVGQNTFEKITPSTVPSSLSANSSKKRALEQSSPMHHQRQKTSDDDTPLPLTAPPARTTSLFQFISQVPNLLSRISSSDATVPASNINENLPVDVEPTPLGLGQTSLSANISERFGWDNDETHGADPNSVTELATPAESDRQQERRRFSFPNRASGFFTQLLSGPSRLLSTFSASDIFGDSPSAEDPQTETRRLSLFEDFDDSPEEAKLRNAAWQPVEKAAVNVDEPTLGSPPLTRSSNTAGFPFSLDSNSPQPVAI